MTLTAPRRALVVIDVQNDYDIGGALEIAYPPFAETLANIGRAMDAATVAGVPVAVVEMVRPETYPVFARGRHGAALHPEVARRRADHHIAKTMASAFTGTDLEPWLRRQGCDTVTVVGYMTQNCDLATVIYAAHLGFAVEVLADATGTIAYANAAGRASAEEIHRVALCLMQASFAAVTPTRAWIGHVAARTRPEAGSIFASFSAALAARAA
jgi:nicotinamidase-related amidase